MPGTRGKTCSTGDHRSAADRAVERGLMLQSRAEVRAGLLDVGEVVSEPTQIVNDVGAVTEEIHEEPEVGHTCDGPMDSIVEAIEAIDSVRLDGEVQHPRDSDQDEETDEHETKEEHGRGGQGVTAERPARKSCRP